VSPKFSTRLADLRRAGEIAAGDHDAAVAEVGRLIVAYAEGEAVGSLDEVLGLKSRPGQVHWRTEVARQRLHDAYRAVAATISGPSRAARARDTHRRLARYAQSQWRFDRGKYECPYREGDERAALWSIMRLHGGSGPLSEAQIKRLLATATEVSG
jgi:hypothetical protein